MNAHGEKDNNLINICNDLKKFVTENQKELVLFRIKIKFKCSTPCINDQKID